MNSKGRRALIVVDVQNDFCEEGSLAVAGGAGVAAGVTAHLRAHRGEYDVVAGTLDWHIDPGEHFSDDPDFVDSWPRHCEVGTDGAEPHAALDRSIVQVWFRKGQHAAAYSGFEGHDADGQGLAEWLHAAGVSRVDVVGIATDHCVRATALDAVTAGLETRVLLDLTAGVARATTDRAVEQLRAAGAQLVGTPVVA